MGTSPRGWLPPSPPPDPRDWGPRKPKKPRPRPTGPLVNRKAERKAQRGLEKLKAALRERVE